MSSLSIGLIVFACVFGSGLLGLFLHYRLPDHHLAPDSRDVVRLAMALVATTAAMALGLLVGSAKSFYDMQNSEIAQLAANAVSLDRVLAHYGPDAKDARQLLRTRVSGFDSLSITHNEGAQSAGDDFRGEDLYEAIQGLSPETDRQRDLKNQASELALEMGQTRWLMFEQRTVPVPGILFAVLVFWLMALFISYGVFAKPNATVVAGLSVSAFAVSAAIFLILEMYHPYTGLIQVSDEPIRAAIGLLAR